MSKKEKYFSDDLDYGDGEFPLYNPTPTERFQYIGEALFDLNLFRHRLSKEFPQFPEEIFDINTQSISIDYSICKKGTAYHIVKTPYGLGGYIFETFLPIPNERVIASFTEYNLAELRKVDSTFSSFRYKLVAILYGEYKNVPIQTEQ